MQRAEIAYGSCVATVADHVISALRISGVHRVYGLPGDSLNGFTDAIRRSGEITWEHVRHEETAAFAAAADAALTGQLAVCAGSCGPGNLHLINGLFDAQRSRVPVLAIAAHIPRTEIGSRVLPGDAPAGAVPRVQRLLRAGQHAGDGAADPRDGDARRGRGDAASPSSSSPARSSCSAPTHPDWSIAPIAPTRSVVRPDDESLRQAAEILNGAEAVTILAGAGVAGAHDEVVQARGDAAAHRSCMRCAARSSSSTTTRSTSA